MNYYHSLERVNKIKLSGIIAAGLATALVLLSPFSVLATAPAETGNRYIVVLKDANADSRAIAKEHSRSHREVVSHVYSHALKGYAASMSAADANNVRKDPRVAYVEADGVATTLATTQTTAPWGLDRIDQRSLPLSTTFTYSSTGNGVKAYIIDTGIRKAHTEFGTRVTDGFDAIDGALPADDCNGHGTHVAGTVGGIKYGVAKDVSLINVRVLDCSGSGFWSGVIAGIDFVTASKLPEQPSVANMSIGGGASKAVDDAVKRSIAVGISYSIAAGNSSQDACRFSPSRVAEAMTVGATDSTDSRPSWSNWGACVDWFAPGVNIASAWSTSNTATNTISGTSMAAPHTAGVAALYLQANPSATPQQVRTALYNDSSKFKVNKAKSINSHLLFSSY